MTNQKRILVVDDEFIIRDSFSLLFEQKGYRIDTAENGYDAIELAKENDYSFIFMDVKMPGMDGIETFKKIKDFNPDATTVYMTAYATEAEIAKSLQTGVDGVLYKPFDPLAITTKMKEGDFLSNYEAYFISMWDRCANVLGEKPFVHVLKKSLNVVSEKGHDILNSATVEEGGLSFEKLREQLGSERPVELKIALRALLAEICLNIENLTDSIITKEVTRDIDEELKA